jgi:hypothetical protein
MFTKLLRHIGSVLVVFSCFIGSLNAASRPPMTAGTLIDNTTLVLRVRADTVDPTAFDPTTREAFTRVVFSVSETVAGDWPASTIEFFVRNGLTPEGRLRVVHHMPFFIQGKRYLIFLRAGRYKLSPFVNDNESVFREEDIDTRQVYVNQAGKILRSFTERGFEIGGTVSTPDHILFTQSLGWSFTTSARSENRGAPSDGVVRTELLRQLRAFVRGRTLASGAVFSRPEPLRKF